MIYSLIDFSVPSLSFIAKLYNLYHMFISIIINIYKDENTHSKHEQSIQPLTKFELRLHRLFTVNIYLLFFSFALLVFNFYMKSMEMNIKHEKHLYNQWLILANTSVVPQTSVLLNNSLFNKGIFSKNKTSLDWLYLYISMNNKQFNEAEVNLLVNISNPLCLLQTKLKCSGFYQNCYSIYRNECSLDCGLSNYHLQPCSEPLLYIMQYALYSLIRISTLLFFLMIIICLLSYYYYNMRFVAFRKLSTRVNFRHMPSSLFTSLFIDEIYSLNRSYKTWLMMLFYSVQTKLRMDTSHTEIIQDISDSASNYHIYPYAYDKLNNEKYKPVSNSFISEELFLYYFSVFITQMTSIQLTDIDHQRLLKVYQTFISTYFSPIEDMLSESNPFHSNELFEDTLVRNISTKDTSLVLYINMNLFHLLNTLFPTIIHLQHPLLITSDTNFDKFWSNLKDSHSKFNSMAYIIQSQYHQVYELYINNSIYLSPYLLSKFNTYFNYVYGYYFWVFRNNKDICHLYLDKYYSIFSTIMTQSSKYNQSHTAQRKELEHNLVIDADIIHIFELYGLIGQWHDSMYTNKMKYYKNQHDILNKLYSDTVHLYLELLQSYNELIHTKLQPHELFVYSHFTPKEFEQLRCLYFKIKRMSKYSFSSEKYEEINIEATPHQDLTGDFLDLKILNESDLVSFYFISHNQPIFSQDQLIQWKYFLMAFGDNLKINNAQVYIQNNPVIRIFNRNLTSIDYSEIKDIRFINLCFYYLHKQFHPTS